MQKYVHLHQYLESLFREHGLVVAIKDFVGFTAKDPAVASLMNPYSIHYSPFCVGIKSHERLFDTCQRASEMLRHACEREAEWFVGPCYAGYPELILPVRHEARVIAAICVGGLPLAPELSEQRLAALCAGRGLSLAQMRQLLQKSLSPNPPSLEFARTACGILADFYRMYYTALVHTGVVDPDVNFTEDASRLNTLNRVIEYVHLHYAEDIRLRDIARFCQCSESYISHLFKRNMNQNINRFINQVRVEHARRMLASGTWHVGEVGLACGFSDPNYFSSVFRQVTGHSPSEYRRLGGADPEPH